MANHKQHHNCHETQLQFAAHIRHPQQNPAPADIEDRRLAIYRNLFYNNIESFLASGFPVLKSIIEEAHWHSMVRDFIHRHQSHSPLFLKISEEFLSYLQTERTADARDPEFMLELAHYEWVELALDISTIDIPNNLQPQANMLDDIPPAFTHRLALYLPVPGAQNRPPVSAGSRADRANLTDRLSHASPANRLYGDQPHYPSTAGYYRVSTVQRQTGYS